MRFKPGKQESSKLVLPLHQVLQFKKKGQKLSRDFRKDYGINSEQLLSHLNQGGDVAPGIMQALIEAEQLNILYESSKGRKIKTSVWNEETGKLEDAEYEVFNETENNEGGFKGDINTNADKKIDISLLKERTVQKMENDENIANNSEADKNKNNLSENFQFYNSSAKLLAIMKSRVAMYVPGAGVKQFNFSSIYGPEDQQENIYNSYGSQPVLDVLNGINASILCYGQTGAGKTHTMFGNQEIVGDIIRDFKLYGNLTQRTKDNCGVVLRAMDEILNFKNHKNTNKIGVNVKYLQI